MARPSASRSATWPPDHAVHSACRSGHVGKDGHAPRRLDGSIRKRFERQRQQRIARQNGGRFAEFLVAGGLAAPQVIVVERGQVVVNQRVGVNEFERARDRQNRSRRPRKKSARIPGTESAGRAFRRPARCSAWRGGSREAARFRRASAGPGQRPPRPGLLRKMREGSSGWQGVARTRRMKAAG